MFTNILIIAMICVAYVLVAYILIQTFRINIKLNRPVKGYKNESWAELAKVVKWKLY